jgi:hypothetical protein
LRGQAEAVRQFAKVLIESQ